MKKCLINVDFTELAIIFSVLGLLICLFITILSAEKNAEEKECYKFYKQNKYILESCEKWRYKYEK